MASFRRLKFLFFPQEVKSFKRKNNDSNGVRSQMSIFLEKVSRVVSLLDKGCEPKDGML